MIRITWLIIRMSWNMDVLKKRSQPLRELMPALMISSTSSRLDAITVQEFTI